MYIGNPESLNKNYEKQAFVCVGNLFDETNVIEFQTVTEDFIEQTRRQQNSDKKFNKKPNQ